MNLRKLVLLILSLSFISSLSFPQNEKDILIDYLKVLRPYTQYNQTDFTKLVDSLSIDSLKQIAGLMYKAHENGSEKVTLAFQKIYKNEKDDFISPWLVQNAFHKRFEKAFPLLAAIMINTSILIRAKIIGKRIDSTMVYENNYINYPEYKILIEEAPKGKNYAAGDTSWFYYMYHWSREEVMDTYHVKEFKEGESYLLPLNTVYSEGRIWYALDGYYFYFDNLLIQDGYLYDERNTFGLGQKVNWDEFKRKFLEDAEKIKSGKGW